MMAMIVCAALIPVPAAASATSQAVQVASSAQLVLDARALPGRLMLWVSRTRNHQPVSGAGNLSVRLDGHAAKVSTQHGAYVISTSGLRGGRHSLEVIVAHDGIRELLSGTVTLPNAPTTLETLQKHSGWAWWILNIGVLLLAVRLISRRKKTA